MSCRVVSSCWLYFSKIKVSTTDCHTMLYSSQLKLLTTASCMYFAETSKADWSSQLLHYPSAISATLMTFPTLYIWVLALPQRCAYFRFSWSSSQLRAPMVWRQKQSVPYAETCLVLTSKGWVITQGQHKISNCLKNSCTLACKA